MFAVIATGGKQYRVAPGDVIRVEKLNVEEGDNIDFANVLMVDDGENTTVGTPYVEGGKVTGKVKSQGRANKIAIVKFRRRKNYRKKLGHRQAYTEVEITTINS